MHEAGPYDLLSLVGEGGYASVYRAVHRYTNNVAAVKVQWQNPVAAARFRREIRVLRLLDHPHVMTVIEADPDARWYAMPLADEPLRRLRQRDPFAWDELRRALGGVSGALMHMHALGYVHRDVSPDNVLRLPEDLGRGRWVLSDYGLAHPLPGKVASITLGNGRLGTNYFSAPEVHHDPASARPSADAYSIGAIAEWFTGISPDASGLSAWGHFWAELINGTRQVFDPSRRWTIDQIARHLEEVPAAPVPSGFGRDACTRCNQATGLDAAGRCLECGHLDPY